MTRALSLGSKSLGVLEYDLNRQLYEIPGEPEGRRRSPHVFPGTEESFDPKFLSGSIFQQQIQVESWGRPVFVKVLRPLPLLLEGGLSVRPQRSPEKVPFEPVFAVFGILLILLWNWIRDTPELLGVVMPILVLHRRGAGW